MAVTQAGTFHKNSIPGKEAFLGTTRRKEPYTSPATYPYLPLGKKTPILRVNNRIKQLCNNQSGDSYFSLMFFSPKVNPLASTGLNTTTAWEEGLRAFFSGEPFGITELVMCTRYKLIDLSPSLPQQKRSTQQQTPSLPGSIQGNLLYLLIYVTTVIHTLSHHPLCPKPQSRTYVVIYLC